MHEMQSFKQFFVIYVSIKYLEPAKGFITSWTFCIVAERKQFFFVSLRLYFINQHKIVEEKHAGFSKSFTHQKSGKCGKHVYSAPGKGPQHKIHSN